MSKGTNFSTIQAYTITFMIILLAASLVLQGESYGLLIVIPAGIGLVILLGLFQNGWRFIVPYLLVVDITIKIAMWTIDQAFGINFHVFGLALDKVYGFFVGGQLVGFALLRLLGYISVGRIRLSLLPFERFLILFFIGMNLLSALVGLVRGQPLLYWASDTYKLLVMPAMVFLVISTLARKKVKNVFIFLIWMSLISTLAMALILIFRFIQGGYGRLIVPLYLLPFFLMKLLRGTSKEKWVFSLLILIVLALSLLSLSRRIYYLTLLTPFLVLALERWHVVARNLGVFVLISLTIVGSIVVMRQFESPLFLRRIIFEATIRQEALIRQGIKETSLRRKLLEIENVLHNYASSGLHYYLTGFGNGAIYKPMLLSFAHPGEPLEYAFVLIPGAEEFSHTIHCGYTNILFRQGPIGLALFLVFAVLLLRQNWYLLQQKNKFTKEEQIILKTTLIYSVLELVSMLSVSGIYIGFSNIEWPFFVGLVSIYSRTRE